MKKVKASLVERGASEDEVKEFETGAMKFAKKVYANFGDYEFLIGESMDPDGMYVEHYTLIHHTSKLTGSQGCPPQLPRGRCHSLRLPVEARS